MADELALDSAGRPLGGASSRKRAGRWLANAALGLVLLFVLFPIVWLVQMSIRPDEDILGYQLLFTPTLAHYSALVESKFLHSFLNSVVSSCVSTLVALLVGTPAAYRYFGKPLPKAEAPAPKAETPAAKNEAQPKAKTK